MFSTTDTIVAVATPPGRGGIGIVRMSGSDAVEVARRLLDTARPLRPRHATLTRVLADQPAGSRTPIDQVVATYFAAPASYTGEDVIEISGHGSPVLMRAIVRAAIAAGARLAEPGEFTLRAFLSGRMDLVQAEAVRDIVDAVTPLQARAAFDQLEGTLTTRVGEIDRALFQLIARLEASLDFPDEGYHFVDRDAARDDIDSAITRLAALAADGRRGRLLREGRQVVILGRPNAGKSTLFNALVGSDRAIVTATPGTTRDLVSERIDLDGVPVTLVDTAGIREDAEDAEAEGVRRSRAALAVADVTLVVLDASTILRDEDRGLLAATAGRPRVIVRHKIDLPAVWSNGDCRGPTDHPCDVSSVSGVGLDELRLRIVGALEADDVAPRDDVGITNVRHLDLVDAARVALERAREAASAAASEEMVLADLQAARAALEGITGARADDAVLSQIFSSFCIGK